jgi:uncharacterized peroxidase-related enzyme
MHHHGRSLGQLTNDEVLVAEVAGDPAQAALAPRARALVNYAIRLTRSPATTTEDHVAALRTAGLSDGAIHDTACVVAYYNFVNRVASGLGVQLERAAGQ